MCRREGVWEDARRPPGCGQWGAGAIGSLKTKRPANSRAAGGHNSHKPAGGGLPWSNPVKAPVKAGQTAHRKGLRSDFMPLKS